MSAQIQCRQCGKFLPRSDFPTGDFKCPDCNWTQLLSASGRSRPKKSKAARAAAVVAAVVTNARPEKDAPDRTPGADTAARPDAEPAPCSETPPDPPRALDPLPVLEIDALRALTCADFTRWCLALLSRFGYVVSRESEHHGSGCDLELDRCGEKVLVGCIAFSERENVGRPECQKLAESMERRKIDRGMLLSPGSFEDGCRALAQRSTAGRIQLIDGERLELTAREIANGPLAAWWG